MYRCKECHAVYKNKVEYCDCGNDTFDYIPDTPTTNKQPAKKIKQPPSLEQKAEFVSRAFFLICLIIAIGVWFIPIGSKPVHTNKQTNKTVKVKVQTTIPDINKIWDNTPPEQQPTVNKNITPTPAESPRRIEESPILQQFFDNRQTSVPKTSYQPIPQPVQPKRAQTVQKKTPVTPKPVVSQTETPIELQQKALERQARQQNRKNTPQYNPNSPAMLTYKGTLRGAMFSQLAVGSIQGSGSCEIQFGVDKSGKIINRKFVQESSNKALNDSVYYMMMSVPKFLPPPDGYNGENIRMKISINNGEYEISIH